jgi:hypothetical protein
VLPRARLRRPARLFMAVFRVLSTIHNTPDPTSDLWRWFNGELHRKEAPTQSEAFTRRGGCLHL